MAKSLEELSAAELFELAQRRQQEEKERQREAVKEQVESLRTKRRDAIARHKKELAAIDAEIRALTGNSRAPRTPRARGKIRSKAYPPDRAWQWKPQRKKRNAQTSAFSCFRRRTSDNEP